MTFEGAITAVGNIVPNTMDAIGRLFPGVPLGSVDRAKSRSVKRTLRDMEIVKNIGAEKEMSQESIDALCSAIAKERVGCERLSNVVSFAAELEPDVSRADEVDPAWVEAFRRHAERAVDEEAQRTWASVLAGELDRPGSVSKKTMSILGDMSRSEARAFQKLCGCSIEAVDPDGGKKLLPMIECKGPGRVLPLKGRGRVAGRPRADEDPQQRCVCIRITSFRSAGNSCREDRRRGVPARQEGASSCCRDPRSHQVRPRARGAVRTRLLSRLQGRRDPMARIDGSMRRGNRLAS